MCNAATIQMIEEVCEEKVKAGEMFTAYDVSQEVRRRGGNDRHRNMKRHVHDFHCRGLMGGEYTRTLVSIPGAKAKAYLYHQSSDDPTLYQPQPRRRARDGAYRADRRARLCIPVYWLRSAGLLPGTEAFVTSDDSSHSLIVTRDRPDPSKTVVLQTYKVEKDGNVRIARATLQRAGLRGKSFAIDGDSARVLLRLHKKTK